MIRHIICSLNHGKGAMRRMLVDTIVFSLFLICCGCSTLGTSSRLALPSFMKFKATSASVSDEEAESPVDASTSSSNRDPLVAEKSSASTQIQTVHDAETNQLIQSELADLEPAARAEWVEYLNSVEPNMVQYALKARKLKEPSQPVQSPPKNQLVAEIVPEVSEDPNIQTVSREVQETEELSNTLNTEVEVDEHQAKSNTNADSTLSVITEETNPIAGSGLEAPDPSEEHSWSNRIKSLADPTRIWPSQEMKTFGKKPAGEVDKRDRLSLLPKILGGGEVVKEVSETAPADSLTFDLSQQPQRQVPDTGQLRISSGSELWEDELDKLISLLEAETSASIPGSAALRSDVRKQVALRMLYLVGDQPHLAQQAIPGISQAEQEYWTALFVGLSDYLDEQSPAGPAERATSTITQLKTAAHHLQEISHLQLKNVTFCQKINSFGNYDQYEVDEFPIGQTVLVYTEVRNFRSEPTVDGYYRTKLKSVVEIHQGAVDGKLVDRNAFPPTEDLCRTLRADYYHSYRIDLPSHLTPGPYVLKLTVQDELSKKLTTETIRFSVY